MGRTGPKMKRDPGLNAGGRDLWVIPPSADAAFSAAEKGEIREPTRPRLRHYTRHPSPIGKQFSQCETGTTVSEGRFRSSFGHDNDLSLEPYAAERRPVGNPSGHPLAWRSRTRRGGPSKSCEERPPSTPLLALNERSPAPAIRSSFTRDSDGFFHNEADALNSSRVGKRRREPRPPRSGGRSVSPKNAQVKRTRERRNRLRTEAVDLGGFESRPSLRSPEAEKEYTKRVQRGIRFGCGVGAAHRPAAGRTRPVPPSTEVGHAPSTREEALLSLNRSTRTPLETGGTAASPLHSTPHTPKPPVLRSALLESAHHAPGVDSGSSPLASSKKSHSQTEVEGLHCEEAEWEPETCEHGDASPNHHAGGLLTPLAAPGNYSFVRSPLLSPLCNFPSKPEATVNLLSETLEIKASHSAASSTWQRNLDENGTVLEPRQTKSARITNSLPSNAQPAELLCGSMDIVKSPRDENDDARDTRVQKSLLCSSPDASTLPVTGPSSPPGSPGPSPAPSSGPSTGPSSSPTNATKISTSRTEAAPWLCPLLSGCRRVDVYKRLNKISEGTFGAVYRAQEKETGIIVALKHIKYHAKIWEEGFPMTSLREISILLTLSHPNIVNVKEVVVGANPNQVYMVMEYSEHELRTLLENDRPSFSYAERKRLLYQLLSAVAYMHDQWIIHRDLKTSNLLYGNNGVLKVCDFGMARQFGDPIKPYTHNVVTLWYRAPELLLGQTEYTTAVDIWSVGCIMGEIMLRRPLFNGKSETDALDKIFKLCGTPTESSWPGFRKLPYVLKSNIEFKKHPPSWRSVFPTLKSHFTDSAALSDLGLDLLVSLLALDPEKRPTAQQALQHPFFQEKPLPQRELLMPTAPDSNATARNPRHTRVMVDSSDGLQQRDLFHQCESRYVLGRRVDATRYLSELDEATQKKRAQKESLR